jgi:hypothetical protein
MQKRRLRQSTIQDHFVYRKLRTGYMIAPQEDDSLRVFFVEDMRGRISKASKNEYNVAQALENLGYEFSFQLSIAGGRSLAFGIVLDFLVETAPLPTPVWVHGEYWHKGDKRKKDLEQQEVVKQYMAGGILEPVEIWGMESETVSLATQAIRRKLV